MTGVRIAGGLLAVAMLTAATACTASEQSVHAKTPTAAVTSKHPTETVKPLHQQALPNVKGKTFTSVVVDFPRPGARHVLTENTSRTERAKLLVVYVSNTGDKLKVDDRQS
ncbi:hypothetical protein [Streptomyces melanosporofaciens]|uniref:Uncharacterized protein n=1 Tax=Streptomyces melanosporofaciens TaxID=67327 RepID=A0A1H4I9P6_STRMJ|nr:hypothetical protein [Streptomyces melanosporofaciens]SEB30446.1 hypothetical protein SAMN04490356_0222 [Streptomyces melanosporofaciens]